MNSITTFDTSVFEVVNGQINLTKICKHFNKSIKDWTRNKTTKAFLEAFANEKAEGQIILSVKGGDGEQGSWTSHREIALKLAQWISPQFEVFCIQKLDELFQTGKTELKPKKMTSLEILKASNALIIELEEELAMTKQALVETETLALETKQELEEAKPALMFTDLVHNSMNSITISELAKIINIGPFKLFKMLNKFGYLFSSGDKKNIPYQQYLDNGYFSMIEKVYKDKYAQDVTYTQTLVTGKGQIAIVKKINQSKHK